MSKMTVRRFLSSSTGDVKNRFKIPSLSFSGAGFLGCYHAGAAACLMKHGHLLQPMERPRGGTNNDNLEEKHSRLPPILTGVSAGALMSASISAGVHTDDSMNIIYEVARRTKTHGGIMDTLRPGFSLIDELETFLLPNLQKALGGSDSPGDYDKALFLDRIKTKTSGGASKSLLRIGLTSRTYFKLTNNPKERMESYAYVDQFRDLEDVTAAAILSSYVPLATGPLFGVADVFKNSAVKRASKKVKEMESLGFVKDGLTGVPIIEKKGERSIPKTDYEQDDDNDDDDGKLEYFDGGLANMWPVIDESTVVVSPLNGIFSNPSIAPEQGEVFSRGQSTNNEAKSTGSFIKVNDNVELGMNYENLETLYRIAHSSDEAVLESRFQSGYDDTRAYLKKNDLLSVYSA